MLLLLMLLHLTLCSQVCYKPLFPQVYDLAVNMHSEMHWSGRDETLFSGMDPDAELIVPVGSSIRS